MWLLTTIWSLKEYITIAFGLGVAGKIAWDFWTGTRFIVKVLPDLSVGYAARKMFWAMVYAPKLGLVFTANRLAAARFVAELEILKPASNLPLEADYEPAEFGRRLARWQKDESDRRKEIRNLIWHHFGEKKPSLPELCRRAVVWLWRRTMELFLRSKVEPVRYERPSTVVAIDNFPSLDSSRRSIKHYFDYLAAMTDKERAHRDDQRDPDDDDRPDSFSTSTFIATVEIKVGYVAPIFLITGLINRFNDEDGWQLILNNYRALVESDDKYSAKLRELRSFLFNCWLLWGPSVATCSCNRWIPEARERRRDLLIQYGYGDENNSIDLLVKKGREPTFEFKLRRSLGHQLNTGGAVPTMRCAAPYAVKGKFTWGPTLAQGQISQAQQLVQGGSPDFRKPLSGRIVLECKDEHVVELPSDHSRYYSAYLWIMFWIGDKDGKPYFDQQCWKNLLVFFEHGNIAEPSTLQTLKENLVAKVCSSLSEILSSEADKGRVSIHYACAFDDPHCELGEGDMSGASSGTGGRPTRLLHILRKELPKYHELFVGRTSHRLEIPEGSRPAVGNPFSSCCLPETIEGFYRDLQTGVAIPGG
jgi:hypothetical protein